MPHPNLNKVKFSISNMAPVNSGVLMSHLLAIDTKLVTFAGFCFVVVCLFLLFYVYTQDQLLAACSMLMLTGARLSVPHELRKKRRGRHAAKKRRHRPVLSSIVMGNIRSISNKMDELVVLT